MLIFIDLLLLPNFPFFIMPLSLPVVVWMIFSRKIKIVKDKELLVYILLGLLVVFSVILSFFQINLNTSEMTIFIDNVKRAGQLLTSFLYYFIIKNSSIKSEINLKIIMMIFISIYILLGIVSFVNIALYFRILELLGINNPFVSDWFLIQRVELFRYSYIWIDPNNAAYAFQMVVFYMLLNEKLNQFEKFYIYASLVLSLILSMSTGALLSASVFFSLYFVIIIRNIFISRIVSRKFFLKALFIIAGFVLIGVTYSIFDGEIASLFSYSIDRMLNNTGDGRLRIYLFIFNYGFPNLIGEGFTLVRDGMIFKPHSDHLRFMYSYGLIAHFLSLWFFFRHIFFSTKYLFIIPGFISYSINSLIDEQKILLILLSLIAYARCKSMQVNRFNNLIERSNKYE